MRSTIALLSRLSLLLICASLSTAAAPPNLIVIMTDDMGYGDVGFNGCKDIPTPHIDSIATNGVKFTSGYVAYSVCGPSRAAFITGRYGQRFGFERNPQYKPHDDEMGLTLKENTIPDALGKVGYHSGIIGKWHLGATKNLHPLNRGFDEFYGHLGGGHQYLPELLTIQDSYSAKNEAESYRTWIMKNHTPVAPKKYLTDEFSDEAVSFIDRNKAKPFFLFVSYNAPHSPLQATPKYLNRFPDIPDKKRRTYAAMVSAVDDGVGQILQSLRDNSIEENTIVFFLSDNGGPYKKNASLNGPLRGGKGDPWEGGIRVPMAAQWPAKITKGSVYTHPVISLDIFGTIAAQANAPIAPERPLDGVNLLPYLTGTKPEPPHKGIFLRKFDQNLLAVRSGDHKLVVFRDANSVSLHNLRDDLSEQTNIRDSHPEVHQRLMALWNEWDAKNIEPTFVGLSQTPEWKRKAELARKRKLAAEAKTKTKSAAKPNADEWKNQFFKKYPTADTDGDGTLSWAEYKSHKTKINATK